MRTEGFQFDLMYIERGEVLGSWHGLVDPDGMANIECALREDCDFKALQVLLLEIVQSDLHPAMKVKLMVVNEILRSEIKAERGALPF